MSTHPLEGLALAQATEVWGLAWIRHIPLRCTDSWTVGRSQCVRARLRCRRFREWARAGLASLRIVTTQHPAYQAQFARVPGAFTSPEFAAHSSTPDQIAEVVFEAATEGKDQLRYVTGQDAQAAYAEHLNVGSEAFHRTIEQRFLG